MPHFKLVEGGMCRKGLHVLVADGIRTLPDGRRLCVECIRATDRKRYVRDHAKRREQGRRLYHEREKPFRRERLLKTFGLTEADYNERLAAQGGVCAICATDKPAGRWGTHFAVDHDHSTGAVRGLLCGHCNVMLGNAKDDPARLRAAADYLETER